jgi:geranylgeranyl pyrophosphate synthase
MSTIHLRASNRLFSIFDGIFDGEDVDDGQGPASGEVPRVELDVHAPFTYDVIHRAFADKLERRLQTSIASTGLVRNMIDYHLATGGKRLRALLPVWVCANLDSDAEAAFDVGVGLELLHNATLVHDDLQDGDTRRRGWPTVWCRWGAAQAINAGAGLIFEAFACIARTAVGDRLVGPMAATSLRLVEGQAMEFQLKLPRDHPEVLPITPEVWQTMARAKTGSLFGLCLRAGAVAAGQREAFAEAAARYGEGLGLLFQVQDDLLDLVGDKGRAYRGSDLKEGKLSFPVVLAYTYASPEEVEPIRAVLDRPYEERTSEMVNDACDALERCGALAMTATWLREAAEAAIRHPLSSLVPGCVEKFLAPVRHAIGASGCAASS